jgi:crossover junction endodeoxyribonuclease RuvC
VSAAHEHHGATRILGLDPGSLHTGWGAVEVRGRDVGLVEVGRLSPPARMPLPQRLAHLAAGIGALVDRLSPALVVLEAPFLGGSRANAHSLIVLAQARGALLAALGGRGLDIREVSPAEVKAAVTGSGRADKAQVARMVRLLLHLEGVWASDATDALATALCVAHRLKTEPILGPRRRR